MEREIKEYQSLNQVAKIGGVVIFGEHEDREIPVGELRESFNLEYSAYNRSFSDLTLDNAVELYDSCVASLSPDTVMLHIGNNGEYWKDISGFEQKYIALIKHIKEVSKGVRVVVVSVNDEETNKTSQYDCDQNRDRPFFDLGTNAGLRFIHNNFLPDDFV